MSSLVAIVLSAALPTGMARAAGALQPLTVTVDSDINLGVVTAAASGDTLFRIDAASGSVIRLVGSGTRASGGLARATVRIACSGADSNGCETNPLTVEITPAGSPSNRARSLSLLTIASGTASLATMPSGGMPVTFTLSPIGEGGSKTFYVGADFPIAGDNVGLPTGDSEAEFLVTVSGIPSVPATQTIGRAKARVIRALAISRYSGLSFGAVIRPAPGAGTGSVTIDPLSGVRTVIAGVGVNGSTPTAANFTVTGEAGETISIGIPPSFVLDGPTPITVTTSSTVQGAPSLVVNSGGVGTYNFSVGGSYPITNTTEQGSYSGTFTVTADYN